MPTNDNIIWETMSSLTMTPYNTLYEELLDKCYPQKFMQPYDKHKVDVAIDITDQLKHNQSCWHDIKDNELTDEFRQILTQAINELGISINASRLYDYLKKSIEPFIYRNDATIAHDANSILSMIEEKKNDILQLDNLYHSTQYKSYLNKIRQRLDYLDYTAFLSEIQNFINKINTSYINQKINIIESQKYKEIRKKLQQYKGNQINDINLQIIKIEEPIKKEIERREKKDITFSIIAWVLYLVILAILAILYILLN
ncbi:MAG: hypothetical protein IJS05_06130 [Paludibacteraceae bacterium]|nr:hypothetical protein [Paludibacteraceae bacterium]